MEEISQAQEATTAEGGQAMDDIMQKVAEHAH